MPWQVFGERRPSIGLATSASPAHIASLVRAPLRWSEGGVRIFYAFRGKGLRRAVCSMDSGFRRNDAGFDPFNQAARMPNRLMLFHHSDGLRQLRIR